MADVAVLTVHGVTVEGLASLLRIAGVRMSFEPAASELVGQDVCTADENGASFIIWSAYPDRSEREYERDHNHYYDNCIPFQGCHGGSQGAECNEAGVCGPRLLLGSLGALLGLGVWVARWSFTLLLLSRG